MTNKIWFDKVLLMHFSVSLTKLLILFTILLTFIFAYPVFAETTTDSKTTKKERIKERIENRKLLVQERIADIKERIASREASLREKLATFKDKRKSALVERVNTNLNRINQNRTDHFKKFLENASRILLRLEQRVATKAAEGADTTKANAAIADARVAIASASAAVNAQALMDYTITISSESAAKADVKEQRNALHEDLSKVKQLVMVAKQAVANAIRVAATTLKGVGKGSE